MPRVPFVVRDPPPPRGVYRVYTVPEATDLVLYSVEIAS